MTGLPDSRLFPWRAGNRCELLVDGECSFPRLLAAIAAVDNFPDATDSVLRDALATLRTTLGNVVPAQQTCEIATATGLLAQLEHAASLCRAPDVAEARLATIRMGRAPRRAARRPDPVGATT